jgi:hypothetical protein
MKLASAYGTTESESWLEKPAQDLYGEREGTKRSRQGQGGLRTGLGARRKPGLAGTSLLSLPAELRQNDKKEFWIALILWAASWGGLALPFV